MDIAYIWYIWSVCAARRKVNMREPPILTTELTLQLERGVAPKETASAEMNLPRVIRFGKTIACKQCGPWPPSRVFCFNGDDVGRLGEILAFFGDIDPDFLLVHGGYRPEVGQALSAAGYCMHEWKQTILYGLPIVEPPILPPSIFIERVTSETIETAAEVAAVGNGWPDQWRESAKDGIRRSIDREHFQLFLARYEREPVGISDLSRSRASDSWCCLGNAAVIPRFRCRGIHTALLQHRLHTAFKQGYELVVGGADFGSTSFRNQQRVGLRLGYVETMWRRLRS
jgi:predicted N-acetyltransferase YhbS